jgi:hypothetical protein
MSTGASLPERAFVSRFLGNKDAGTGVKTNMAAKTFAGSFSLSVLMTGLLAQSPPQPVPERDRNGAALKQFVGTWKGFCADGKEFVVLILKRAGTGLGGTVSIGNFEGPEGQCTKVADGPSEEHAMKVTDVQLQSAVLRFKGTRSAEFEMDIVDTQVARLKFLGTPVENNPWELKKSD